MRYHIDTIPIWESIESPNACPLCYLHDKCEKSEIDKSLGGSVMEPDVRMRVSEQGFCGKHQILLYECNNRLGHALMLDSHSKELINKLTRLNQEYTNDSKFNGLFGRKKDHLSHKLKKLSSGCIICKATSFHMHRYFKTMLYLYKNDTTFKEKWLSGKMYCIPHVTSLIEEAEKTLSKNHRNDFIEVTLTHLIQSLSTTEKDLEWFLKKFDYNNHSLPWNNSKDALPRMIHLLRSSLKLN